MNGNRQRTKPNIVMIMADQMAYDVIGALGHPAVKTPNIDKLVNSGIAFRDAYCNSPLCAPSRAALVSGKRVSDIGVYDNGAELPASTPTFLHHLRRSGYETVLSGKMHFVGPDQLHGFEHRLTADIYPSHFEWTPDWSLGVYANPGTSIQRGLREHNVCDWNGQYAYDEKVASRTLEKIHEYGTGKRDTPLFLCASFTHPHDPFEVIERYWNLYDGVDIPLPKAPYRLTDELHPYNRWIQVHHEADRGAVPMQKLLDNRRAYYGMVSYFDEKVGQIVDELERLHLSENTVVVITSDHGEMLGEHGMWFKRTFYDPAAKVPLIFSWPACLPAGKVVDEVVSLVDLGATFLELACTADCDQWGEHTDGDSLVRLLKEEDPGWKDEAFCEYLGEGILHPMAMLRHGRYKYVHVHGQSPQLFDMESDPAELYNLADAPAFKDISTGFHERMMRTFDFENIEQRVIRSQQERKMIAEALGTGMITGWDYRVPDMD